MAETPTVYQAWSAVMRDVQAISKDSRNTQQNFSFRGIDAVLNTVGPVLREHGVLVVPIASKHDSERYTTKSGGQMVNRTVEMAYQVFGPAGDSFMGSAFGEAADAGDKAMTKAESVALRTFLLQALMIPTDDPDPDASSHEREVPPSPVSRPAVASDDNAESREARAALKAKAEKNSWDLNKIAAKFESDNQGKKLKNATAAEVEALDALLTEGLVKV